MQKLFKSMRKERKKYKNARSFYSVRGPVLDVTESKKSEMVSHSD